MRPTSLLLVLPLAVGSSDPPPALPRVAAWSAAARACGPAGSEGYILRVRGDGVLGRRLEDGPSPGERYAEKLRARWRHRRSLQELTEPDTSNEVLFTYRSALHGLAARLNETELDEVLADPLVEEIERNCIIRLDPIESYGHNRTASFFGAVGARTVQTGAVWGLDRIDSRSGLDNQYNYGTATGSNSVIYILDTVTPCACVPADSGTLYVGCLCERLSPTCLPLCH